MNIETLLNEEIEQTIKKLRGMEVGSDEYKATADVLTKLMDRAIEIEKVNNDTHDKEEARKDENKDRLIKNILSGVGVVLPVAVTIWGTVKSIEFEKEGTITTIIGRGFINKLLPKK